MSVALDPRGSPIGSSGGKSVGRLFGWSGLPSIFVGRPSLLRTITGIAAPSNGAAVAKKSALPGTYSSGCLTFGTIFSGGWKTQPLNPANARDAPISLMNVRRSTGECHSSACCGNSRSTNSRNTGVSASSSRLRQYFFPPRGGKKYWRSLEELADTPVFREFVEREFPQQAEEWHSPVERRTFIKLMGASLALAGLSGCVFQPPEKIVPKVKQPEEYVPGKALFFATAAPLLGAAIPVIVRSNEGRPTKIEGNPDHPNNRPTDFPPEDPIGDPRGSSATDIFTQASILSLYDPDRSPTLTYREDIRTWTSFVGEMRSILDEQRPNQGKGIRFLTESIISPTFGALMKELQTALPQAKWHQYEPANRDNARAGAIMALGQPVNTTYRFDLAQRILSLDCDFLAPTFPGYLRYSRDFMARRRITETNKKMNRLYVVETTPSNTGAIADHAWEVKPSEFEAVAKAIAAGSAPQNLPWIAPLVKDLQQHNGASIVLAGDNQPPIIHALGHAMNNALGNVGKTGFYTDPLGVNSEDN